MKDKTYIVTEKILDYKTVYGFDTVEWEDWIGKEITGEKKIFSDVPCIMVEDEYNNNTFWYIPLDCLTTEKDKVIDYVLNGEENE